MPDHVHMLLSIPPKIRGVAGRRVHQGQERDPLGPGLWRAQAQFRGPAFLGPWALREHGAPGWGVIRAYIRNQEREDQNSNK